MSEAARWLKHADVLRVEVKEAKEWDVHMRRRSFLISVNGVFVPLVEHLEANPNLDFRDGRLISLD